VEVCNHAENKASPNAYYGSDENTNAHAPIEGSEPWQPSYSRKLLFGLFRSCWNRCRLHYKISSGCKDSIKWVKFQIYLDISERYSLSSSEVQR